ncbi:uncharacterized protein LOC114930372 isoform X2 [Nylanderia fulva]|uniref:uncharacterized protein LOC114930372 isoform X2 n=1 Tax=Nylanderia fulva TaxID=613905 RepID=UPI0010FB9E86|nr:uncharacterized protein LOC114930372 isoform X2 [Nylanderia fulva]
MVMGRKITCRLHSSASELLRKTVFPILREDEVIRAIRYDELLILYGNKLCMKYKSQHHHDMIRAQLRLLGRLFLAMKDINENIESFESIYNPKVYDDCICAINKVAKYNSETKMYETPAVAANLSTLLKHIGNILIIECIKKENVEKKRQVKDFLKLLVVDVGTSINTTVVETQTAHKRRKKINLPTLEDIRKLYSHLEEKRSDAYKELYQSFSYCHWISLAEATLTSIHVFNRSRAGEIERILIEDFNSYEKLNKNMHSDMYQSLSTENKKIAQKYVRFCIRGKLGRTVPVLLSNDLFQSITLILKFRKQAGVSEKNPYVFGLPGNNKERYKYLRACALLRKFAEKCNANQSSTLRGTILRKHVATYCIQLNLNDIDISDLAMFMGHSDKIHKDHYRQPLASRDILKISQYLEAVQGNTNNSEADSTDNNSENDDVLKENSCINNDTAEKEDKSTNNLNISDNSNIQDEQNNSKRKRSTSPYGKTKRIRWSKEEKETALQAFSKYMEKLKLPSLKDIQIVKKNIHCLLNALRRR